MKKTLINSVFAGAIASAFMLLTVISVHAEVLEQMPGKAQAEREIRWLWKYLPDIIKACTQSGLECQKPEIKKVLLQLIPNYPPKVENSNSAWGQRLQFVSEKSRPDIFTTNADEEHRIAVTGLTSDAIVFINADRMNMPISKWVGILTHESVHHLGYTDDETRIPDLVGAAVESQYLKISSNSDLEEFAHPEFRILSANTNKANSSVAILISMPEFGFDMASGPNPRVPICAENEIFSGQSMGTPIWRATRVRPSQGIVKLKASAIVNSLCTNPQAKIITKRQTVFVVVFNLKYKAFDESSAWWTQASKVQFETLISGNDDSRSENVDLFRTMIITSIQHEKAIIQAGETWRSTIEVESIDGFIPLSCEGQMSALNWSFHNNVDLPAVLQADSCSVKSLGSGKYKVHLEMLIPKTAQPDFFYTSWISFTDQQNWRYAVPSRPNVLKIENARSQSPLKITDWRILGLNPIDKILNTAVEKSYRMKLDQTFWLEVDVKGSQIIGNEYLEFDEMAADLEGQVILAPLTVEVQTNLNFIKSFERVVIPGGIRLRYKMTVPSGGSLKLHGIKLLRFYSITDDFSWVEYEMPKVLIGFIVDDSL